MFRKLAPLVASVDSNQSSTSEPSQADISKRKRVQADVACNPCRRRKSRCDGLRPTCATCQKLSSDCTYVQKREALQSSHASNDSQELLDILKSVTEKHAIQILSLWRTDRDIAAVLSFARGVVNGASNLPDIVDDAKPGTGLSLESELMTNFPFVYPKLRAIPATALELDGLLSPNSFRRLKQPENQAGHNDDRPPGDDISSLMSDSTRQTLKDPFHNVVPPDRMADTRPSLCDSRLHQLDISFWTAVSVANDLAARIISVYLTTDHPLLCIFDPDSFISDLVSHQTTNCSRLLVNTVLYWGSQLYAAFDPETRGYADSFCDEAEELWLHQQHNDTILNAASAQLLSLAYLGQGKDHYVLKFLSAAIHMGKRLFLLDVDPLLATRNLAHLLPETKRRMAFTAWGLFNWAVLTMMFYQQPNLEYPEYPPILPIPHSEKVDAASIRVAYVDADRTTPALPWFMGSTFSALCSFWQILHGVGLIYYKNRESSLQEHTTLDFAERKYRELLDWSKTLPPDNVLRDDSPHHVVILHIWFHAAVLDIFRPFVHGPHPYRSRVLSSSEHRLSPDDAFRASVQQLKYLVVKYRSNHQTSTYTMLWQTALIYVANAVLHDTQNPEWRFYFLTCIYAYTDLRKSYRVAESISRALLTMALRGGCITHSEADALETKMTEAGGRVKRDDKIRATFMVDLDLAMWDPEAAKVEVLAKRFDDIVLFRDLATGDDKEAQSFSQL
ncbi:hypothetical protein BDP55DRAFT_651927 [Colletotrichum godetiae]|uniref:Zn(2)-C6 fungal-type domain-containing protein n=1 Tax=Colletotrichum godetiae TaxID=1209918 RepID=A0AAJ0AU75_9PEZI|nr:uncharacterized protein BDP55DRAFT_651927 [Colletotrichum godetiae]KAK1689888.1 hypothetical protein BDP55DRAFT_651927 [Colletotrichum godetiae]